LKPPCAEVLTGGQIVDAVWGRLLDPAGQHPRRPLDDDPDLHLLVDGCRLDAVQRVESAYIFSLPAAASCMRVVSHAAVPAELGLAFSTRPVRLLRIGRNNAPFSSVPWSAASR
jgi:hypothetical protein